MFVRALLVCLAVALATVSAQPLQHVAGSKPKNLIEPLQQRSAFAGLGGTAQVVQWSTYGKLNASTVSYGLTQDISTFNVSAPTTQATYNSSLTYVHTVTLTGLQPGTKYYWYAANTNCTGCQQIPLSSFTTAMAPGDMTPYSTIILADLGLLGLSDQHIGNVSTPLGVFNVSGLANSGAGAVTVFPADAKDPVYDPTHNTMISVNNTLLRGNISFVSHVGDIAYADEVAKILPKANFSSATAPNLNDTLASAIIYEAILESFFDQIQPITSQTTYMVSAGNHESTCSNGKNIDLCTPGQTNFTGYNIHWEMPSSTSGGVKNMWYSYDHGMTHYVVLQSETDFAMAPSGPSGADTEYGTLQDLYGQGPFITPTVPNLYLKWLDNDLASVNRSVTPWIVAMAHRPWYPTNADRAPESQVAFEPYLIKYDVDFMFHGHDHIYERSCPLHYGGNCDANGMNNPANAPVYIIEGGAGHFGGNSFDDAPLSLGGDKSYGDGTLAGLLADKLFEPYSRAYSETYGYGVLTFHNATHASYAHIDSVTEAVIDYSTLYKDHVYDQPAGSVKYAVLTCPAGLSKCGGACYDYLAKVYTCKSGQLTPYSG